MAARETANRLRGRTRVGMGSGIASGSEIPSERIAPGAEKRGGRHRSGQQQDNRKPPYRTTTSQIFERREAPAGPSILSTTTYCPAF